MKKDIRDGASSPPREKRTADDLHRLFKEALRNYPGCTGIVLDGTVVPADYETPEGYTWGYSTIDLSKEKNPAWCANAVALVLADLQKKYDLI